METVEKARTIIHTDIPTAGVFGRGHAWNPIKGCNNKSCFLHPFRTRQCWAAKITNRFAETWAKNERDFLSEKFEKELPPDCNYMKESKRDAMEHEFALNTSGESHCLSQREIKSNLKAFTPTWFESQFEKKFPKKQSCIPVGYMTDISYIEKRWLEKILKRIGQDNQERESAGLPLHVFQFLTESPKVYVRHEWPRNCWLGFTARNQPEYDRRLFDMTIQNSHSFRIRYAYLEPMVEKITIKDFAIKWVIVGGQSGKDAQPLNPDWVRSIRDQCVAAGIPFYFKGWGDNIHIHGGWVKKRTLKRWAKTTGSIYPHNDLDGVTWEQFPEVAK